MLLIITIIVLIMISSMIYNSVEYKSYSSSYKKLKSNFKFIYKKNNDYYFSDNPDSNLTNTIVFFKHKYGINIKLYGYSYIQLSFNIIFDLYKLYYYIKFYYWFKNYLKNENEN